MTMTKTFKGKGKSHKAEKNTREGEKFLASMKAPELKGNFQALVSGIAGAR